MTALATPPPLTMNVCNRRQFLRASAAIAAGAWAKDSLSGEVPPVIPITQERTPFPYVDGLSFLSPDPEDLGRSGLSGFLLDASDGERREDEHGNLRYVRSFEACLRSITAIRRRLLEGEVGRGFLATGGRHLQEAYERGLTGILLQFQGTEPVGEDLDRLETFYELGLRVLQITHHRNTAWGGGALEREWTGLTAVGHEGIERMNALGIIPDLSHVADPTCFDVLASSRTPVIASHTAARALVPNARCTPDSVIRGIAESGGVVGIFMMSFWLTQEPIPTTDAFVRHIRHVADIGGVEAAGIANDFTVAGHLEAKALGQDNAEAVRSYLPWWQRLGNEGILGFEVAPEHVVIPELNNVRRMFRIHRALERAKFTSLEIEMIMGGNWIRVFSDALG